jgi:hypothetical protein
MFASANGVGEATWAGGGRLGVRAARMAGVRWSAFAAFAGVEAGLAADV